MLVHGIRQSGCKLLLAESSGTALICPPHAPWPSRPVVDTFEVSRLAS